MQRGKKVIRSDKIKMLSILADHNDDAIFARLFVGIGPFSGPVRTQSALCSVLSCLRTRG